MSFLFLCIFQIRPDDFCLVRSILAQVVHHKDMYPPDMCMRQIALQMIRNPHKYYKCVVQELLETGESYKSLCYNIYHRNLWGDDLIAAVLGDMSNIAITMVSPKWKHPYHLFYAKEVPDVIVVANGGSWMAQTGKCSTHFSATASTDMNVQLPGSKMENPNLTPIVLQDPVKAKQLALKNFMKDKEGQSLILLRSLTEAIKRLEDKACELIGKAQHLRKQKSKVEYQLMQLGVSIGRIEEATKEWKDPEYVRTEEREKQGEERK